MIDNIFKNTNIEKLFFKEENHDKSKKCNKYRERVLKYFYSKLVQAKKAYQSNLLTISTKNNVDIDDKQRDTLKQFTSNYLPHRYMKEILQEKTYTYVSFKIYHRTFELFFYKMDNTTKSEFELLIKAIWMWLYVLSSVPEITCVKHLTIIFAFLPHKKILYNMNKILGTENVNSALSYVCLPQNKMIIYRKEECFKLFLHETFHSFGLDFSTKNNHIIHAELYNIFNINTKIELAAYESYTEFWAEIIHIIFNAFFISSDFEVFSLYFDTMLRFEQRFSKIQVVKIMNFTKTNIEDFSSLKQTSHVFEYYVLKSLLLLNADAFFEWCFKTNPIFFKIESNGNFIIFVKNYMQLFKKQMNEKERNQIENIISDKSTILSNTMRMTLFDLFD